jgi:F-type H+-transporting ATPase subunit a
MVGLYAPLDHMGVSWVFQAAILAVALLLFAAVSIRKRVGAGGGGGVLPDEGVTIRNVIEVIVIQLGELAESTMGDKWRDHFHVVGTIFFFVLVSNLLGLLPWVGGATSDVNTCAAWAIISFTYYIYVGIKSHGAKYIYHLMGPALRTQKIGNQTYRMRLLAPFFLPLEFVLHVARIATLTIRLTANMFADHTVIAVWISIVPFAVPAIFMGLGLMVSFLQAFVFSLLTMIYIGEALHEAH